MGQEHVTDPLSIALDTGRISHAYLFSGPRGCGKTSSARILARSLNCVQGPTSKPCGVCPSCVALGPGGSGNLDVIELDAASHGGVDDTRELRDRAFYAPAESRYRVFIVDEAHMVTTAGFNALLKIVEEPPAHLIFVFATTEPDKVLPTIRSRTHHYPFRLLPPATMRGLLGKICEQENVPVEESVYPLVIRAGGGSPRDSLSVLDQLLAGAGPEGVTYPRAVSLLGVTDVALIDDAVEALAASDGATLFGTIDRVVEAGHDPRRFATDLLERLRDLILLRAVPDATDRNLVTGPGDVLARMHDQANRLGSASLARYAELLHEGLGDMRGATNPRLLLEVIGARMLLPAVSDAETATLQRLETLERRMAGGAPPPAAPAAQAPRAADPSTPAQSAPRPPQPDGGAPRRRGAEALAALRAEKSGGQPTPEPQQAPAQPQAPAPQASAQQQAPAQPQAPAPQQAASVEQVPGQQVVPTQPQQSAASQQAAVLQHAAEAQDVSAPQVSASSHSVAAHPAERAAAQQASAPESVATPAAVEVVVAPVAAEAVAEVSVPSVVSESEVAESVAAESVSEFVAPEAFAFEVREEPVSEIPEPVSEPELFEPEASDGTVAPGVGVPAETVAPAGVVAPAEVVPPAEGVAVGEDVDSGAAAEVVAPGGVVAPAEVGGEDESVGSGAAQFVSGEEAVLAEIEAAWADIRAKVREFGATVQALLSGASVSRVEGQTIVFAHPAAPLAQRLSQPQNVDAVRSAVRAVLGREHDVKWEVGSAASKAAPAKGGGGRGGAGRGPGREGGAAKEPPRFSRPSQAVKPAGGAASEGASGGSAAGWGAPAGGAGNGSGGAAGGAAGAAAAGSGDGGSGARFAPAEDDIPLPDGPDLPDDPGPVDYSPVGYDGVPPASTEEEEREMLAQAAEPVAPGDRRDPDEVALELLKQELGATPLEG